MALALEWAAKGMYITAPNPRIGCVIVRDGEVIGAGHTQPAGQAHAEIQALRDAQARGNDVRGATAYVTLEPCSHYGRTPPCSNALVEAGLGAWWRRWAIRIRWWPGAAWRSWKRPASRSAPGCWPSRRTN
jgi:diaminohydroxyphosphoribosylaminopyrimidine deaminase/5-amino-6-(5-phosphoribosylamino)uracil reductase